MVGAPETRDALEASDVNDLDWYIFTSTCCANLLRSGNYEKLNVLITCAPFL